MTGSVVRHGAHVLRGTDDLAVAANGRVVQRSESRRQLLRASGAEGERCTFGLARSP
ncbi:MAG: hypothetical protein LC792_24300 [Actinobacteria bacterium]|nr:hypothetical protein [Actinomycetota bacterium]